MAQRRGDHPTLDVIAAAGELLPVAHTADLLEPLDQRQSRIGELIWGRYRLDDLLGDGGMGIVYAATQIERQQPVVIKLVSLPPRDHDESFAQRFMAEVAN